MHIQKTEEDTFGDRLDESDANELMTKAEIFEYRTGYESEKYGIHIQPQTEGKDVEALTEPLLEKSKEELIAEIEKLKAERGYMARTIIKLLGLLMKTSSHINVDCPIKDKAYRHFKKIAEGE